MKKTLFILFIAVLFGSCSGQFEDIIYTITNNSSKTVLFSFNDISVSLNKDESAAYAINSEKGRFAPKGITFTGHQRSISLTTKNNGTSGIFYTFSDNTPLTLNVENKLSIPVTIKAGDFIDNEGQFTIELKEKENKTALIYTSTPSFSVEESDESERTIDPDNPVFVPYPYPYPIKIEWELSNNSINLTIR